MSSRRKSRTADTRPETSAPERFYRAGPESLSGIRVDPEGQKYKVRGGRDRLLSDTRSRQASGHWRRPGFKTGSQSPKSNRTSHKSRPEGEHPPAIFRGAKIPTVGVVEQVGSVGGERSVGKDRVVGELRNQVIPQEGDEQSDDQSDEQSDDQSDEQRGEHRDGQSHEGEDGSAQAEKEEIGVIINEEGNGESADEAVDGIVALESEFRYMRQHHQSSTFG
jgi:hypothetical protein